jgi:hypothetical protein
MMETVVTKVERTLECVKNVVGGRLYRLMQKDDYSSIEALSRIDIAHEREN